MNFWKNNLFHIITETYTKFYVHFKRKFRISFRYQIRNSKVLAPTEKKTLSRKDRKNKNLWNHHCMFSSSTQRKYWMLGSKAKVIDKKIESLQEWKQIYWIQIFDIWTNTSLKHVPRFQRNLLHRMSRTSFLLWLPICEV